MDMSKEYISKLINVDVQLTPETSARLEMVLGIPASFWNNLEAIYRNRLRKIKTENTMNTNTKTAK